MSEKKRSAKEFFMDNNKKNLKIFIIVVVAILVLAAVTMGIYVFAKVGLINIDKDGKVDPDYTLAPEDEFDNMYDATDTSGLDALITAWAKNGGEKYSSKNVINVLLIGVDDAESNTGRSDALILLSLNKRTKKITLVSFLRDSYTYMNIPDAARNPERCCKLNHSYRWGGYPVLIETLENDYKIEIDHYISVDFKSFPKLIDALGGVTLKIEPYEAEYINRTTTQIDKIQSGDAVKLNGAQALVYTRIRHVDAAGDLGRTARDNNRAYKERAGCIPGSAQQRYGYRPAECAHELWQGRDNLAFNSGVRPEVDELRYSADGHALGGQLCCGEALYLLRACGKDAARHLGHRLSRRRARAPIGAIRQDEY